MVGVIHKWKSLATAWRAEVLKVSTFLRTMPTTSTTTKWKKSKEKLKIDHVAANHEKEAKGKHKEKQKSFQNYH